LTHSVDLLSDEDAAKHRFDPNDYITKRCEIFNRDFTNMPYIGPVKLIPTKNPQPYSPFIVAYVSGKIIIRHSGIFEDKLRDFLNDYVALVEGKRMILADPEMEYCKNTNNNGSTINMRAAQASE
jgi:hypothetical protein